MPESITALEYFEKHYKDSEYFERVKVFFPGFYSFLSKVEIIPWRREFQVLDSHPEVYAVCEYYSKLLEEGKITLDEFLDVLIRETKGISAEIVSSTLGVMLASGRFSFRDVPSVVIFLDFIATNYYRVDEDVWTGLYGGGVGMIFWGILEKRISAKKPEELLLCAVKMFKDIEEDYKPQEERILAVLRSKIYSPDLVAEHLGAYLRLANAITVDYRKVVEKAKNTGVSEDTKEFYDLWQSSKELVRDFLEFTIGGAYLNYKHAVIYFNAIFSEYL